MTRRYSGPLVPGTRSVKQKGGRKYLARRARYSSRFYPGLNRKIRTISLRSSETKTSNQKVVSTDLFHNVTHYYSNLLACTQGVTDPIGTGQDTRNRIGQQVIGVGLRIKTQIIAATGRPNCNYLIYIFRYKPLVAQLNDTTFWSGPAGGGATNNRFLDHPNPTRIKVLRKFWIQNLNNYATVDDRVQTVYREHYINLKLRKIDYDQNAEEPLWSTIGMCVTAFDANNTGQTDRLAYSSFASTFYFKDP